MPRDGVARGGAERKRVTIKEKPLHRRLMGEGPAGAESDAVVPSQKQRG